ncbi:MAG: hypothetical protein ACXV3C_04870, partial [Actinomycetes bacterium]
MAHRCLARSTGLTHPFAERRRSRLVAAVAGVALAAGTALAVVPAVGGSPPHRAVSASSPTPAWPAGAVA